MHWLEKSPQLRFCFSADLKSCTLRASLIEAKYRLYNDCNVIYQFYAAPSRCCGHSRGLSTHRLMHHAIVHALSSKDVTNLVAGDMVCLCVTSYETRRCPMETICFAFRLASERFVKKCEIDCVRLNKLDKMRKRTRLSKELSRSVWVVVIPVVAYSKSAQNAPTYMAFSVRWRA